jgi:hypothetical protein
MKAHWYEIFIWECPLCGRTIEYRERRYGRKPKNVRKRMHIEQDACSTHFL